MKKSGLFILLVTFVICACSSAQPWAQDSRGVERIEVTKDGEKIILYEKSYALLIGESKYEHWPDLNSIPREIERLESSLKKHGFIVEISHNPTCSQLSETIKNFIDKYGLIKNNRLLIFFSGHGYTRDNGMKGYIVPADAPDPGVDDQKFVHKAIDMDQILAWAKRIETIHALFVFDSCFSGTVFTSKFIPTPTYIHDLTGKKVRQFITAGSAGETVPSRSHFLPYFIRGIEGEADVDYDNYITGTELGLYLYKEITSLNIGQTPQYGKIRDPELDKGDFIFYWKTDKQKKKEKIEEETFGLIEGARIENNTVIAFDNRGNQLRKSFGSKIVHHVVADIDNNGGKEIIVGFAAEGKEKNHVIAFDSHGGEKWAYTMPQPDAYINPSSGKFRVADMKVFKEKRGNVIAVLLADEYWYQCTLILLSPKGENLKELWHPGHLDQIEKIKDVFIIMGFNNDLRQTQISKDPKRNFSIIFGIKYENIYGQAPPYLGKLSKNVHFEWYCILSDQQVRFKEMKPLGEKILVPTTCGKCFYFNEKGQMVEIGYADSYSCKEPLNLLRVKFE